MSPLPLPLPRPQPTILGIPLPPMQCQGLLSASPPPPRLAQQRRRGRRNAARLASPPSLSQTAKAPLQHSRSRVLPQPSALLPGVGRPPPPASVTMSLEPRRSACIGPLVTQWRATPSQHHMPHRGGDAIARKRATSYSPNARCPTLAPAASSRPTPRDPEVLFTCHTAISFIIAKPPELPRQRVHFGEYRQKPASCAVTFVF